MSEVIFEASGIAISDVISGGTANEVLYTNPSGQLFSDEYFTWNGASSILSATNITTDFIYGTNAAGGALIGDEAASKTNPTFCPTKADETTGVGYDTDAVVLIAKGTTGVYCKDQGGGAIVVAINHDSPLATLDVSGSCRFGDSTTNYVGVESDGDMNFVGGSGLQFAEIYLTTGTVDQTTAAASTWYQVVAFSTDGAENGDCDADHTNDHITIGKTGKYLVTYTITAKSDAAEALTWIFALYKNNGNTIIPQSRQYFHTAADQINRSCSLSCIADLTAADTLELWIFRTTAGVDKVIQYYAVNMTAVQIGG